MVQGITADIPLSIFAAVGFALTALYVAIARRHKPTWTAGVVMLLACAELTLARALQGISPDLATKVFWYKMIYAGFTVSPTAFLCLALRYSGLGSVLTLRTKLLFSVFPVLTNVVIFTNEIHGWMWNPTRTAAVANSPVFLSVSDAGAWYWLFVAYSYCVMCLGCFFLVRLLVRSRQIYGWLASAVVLAAIPAMLGPILDIFNVSPLPPFVSTSFGLAVGSITVAFLLSLLRRRDILPVSRAAIIRSISDGILVVDEDDRIVDLNPAAETLMGMRAAQAIGKPLAQLAPELQSISARQSEVTLHHANELRILDLRVSAVHDWLGHIVSRVIVLRDITGWKQAEEEIRNLARFPRENPSPVLRVAGDGTLLYANPSSTLLLQTWGCEPGQPLPDKWRELARQVLASGAIQETETVCGGTIYSLLFAPVAEAGYVNAYGRDITERKRAGQLLQTLNTAALAMQKSLCPDEIFRAVSNELQKIGFSSVVFATDSARQHLIVKHRSFPSRAIQVAERLTSHRKGGALFPVDLIGVFREAVLEKQSVFIQDTEEVIRQQLPAPFNRLARVLVRVLQAPKAAVAPLVVEGEVIGLLTVHANDLFESDLPTITAFAHQMAAAWRQAQLFEQAQQEVAARRKAEEQIRLLNEELEQRVMERTTQLESANKELESSAYSIAHDLRAPLRGIDGWSLALLEDYGDRLDEQARTYLGRVRSEAQRMGQLIDDLLQLSRVTRADMRRGPVDLTALARAAAARLQEAQPRSPG